jgi:16S rRNA (guanine966-N2)-methyltransferase
MTTRPITDRAKVILFDRIEGLLQDMHVADIFAGTGTMGLEALSRGAATVVFIEQDHKAHELLMQNCAMLEVEDVTLCWRTDAFRSSYRPKGRPELLPFDVIFFDPPYELASQIKSGKLLYSALERLARAGVTADDALLIFRSPHHTEFEMPAVWTPDQTLVINKMDIHFFRKSGNAEETDGPATEAPPESD